jgi:hypothetical protein
MSPSQKHHDRQCSTPTKAPTYQTEGDAPEQDPPVYRNTRNHATTGDPEPSGSSRELHLESYITRRPPSQTKR